MGFFPQLGLENNFFMGDNVILEPVADVLARSLGESVYVLSRQPELFQGHPHVIGARGFENELPNPLTLIDMDAALMKWGGKLRAVYEAAGVNEGNRRAPRLYLTGVELADLKKIRGLFSGPCIGVIPGTRHLVKQWPYVRLLVRQLLKKSYNVFLFSSKLDWVDRKLFGMRVHHVIDKDIRELMKYLRMMDVVVGPDTGPVQIAASLGTRTVVATLPMFVELYEDYTNCTILTGTGNAYRSLRKISVATVLGAVEDYIEQAAPINGIYSRQIFIRIRGIGDVLMLLPAVATLRVLNPNSHYTLVTSPACAALMEACEVFDEVIACQYDHVPYGLPALPYGLDYNSYDVVYNLLNRVEFISSSAVRPRTEIFGQIIGLEKVDYGSNWKGKLPQGWRDHARAIFEEHGCVPDQIVIALQVTSNGRSRAWPKERWTEFVGKCHHKNYKVVLLSDEKINNVPKGVINLTGKCTIEEYVGIIAEASIGLGPDSSLVHLAGWLDEPAIGLFGSIDPALRIAHYSSVEAIVGSASCIPCNDWQFSSCDGTKGFLKCMWSITANKVFRAVERKLREIGLVPKRGGKRKGVRG